MSKSNSLIGGQCDHGEKSAIAVDCALLMADMGKPPLPRPQRRAVASIQAGGRTHREDAARKIKELKRMMGEGE